MPSPLPPAEATPPQGSFPPAAFFFTAILGTTAPSDSRCAPPAFALGLCGRSLPDVGCADGLSCSAPLLQRVLLPIPRRDSARIRTSPRSAWPSPRNARLGSRIVGVTRRQASLHVAARAVAPHPRLSPRWAFDAPLGPNASRLRAGACYRALRRLPGRDSHPL